MSKQIIVKCDECEQDISSTKFHGDFNLVLSCMHKEISSPYPGILNSDKNKINGQKEFCGPKCLMKWITNNLIEEQCLESS